MTTRRRFLTSSTAALAAPLIMPASRLFGADAPGRTIRLGHIGVGNQGTSLLQNFLSAKGAMSVAIADPFRQRREAAAQRVKATQGHDAKLYNDFRELLADDSIDAVIIATPDHWHVPIGLAAVRAGKDVYIEKPHFKKMMDDFDSNTNTLNRIRGSAGRCRAHGNVFERQQPNVLYNAMLHPVIPYAARGMVWYQGEANAARPAEYAESLPLWIQRLRAGWGNDKFHLLVVMLPGFSDGNWPRFREVQLGILKTPHTGGGIGEIWRGGAMGLMHDKKPVKYREFMDNRQWFYELSRRFDGSMGIVGATIGNGNQYDDPNSWGIGRALSYTLPRKTLRITGAPATKFSKPYQLPKRPWGTEADEAFYSLASTAGRDGKVPDWDNEKLATDAGGPIVRRLEDPEVTDDVLLRYVRHPDHGVRQIAANAIGRRSGDGLILELLKDGKVNACKR